MPLPTIADVFRIALNWRDGIGGEATNVIHVSAPGSTIVQVASRVENAFTADMWNTVWNAAFIESMDITELDGSSDAEFFPVTLNADVAGTGGNEYFPQGCALIKLDTGGGGRSGRGRVYLPWLGEAANHDGSVTATNRDNTTAAWVAFANDIGALGVTLGVASYTNASFRPVANLICEERIGTQRRRLKR